MNTNTNNMLVVTYIEQRGGLGDPMEKCKLMTVSELAKEIARRGGDKKWIVRCNKLGPVVKV